MQESGAYPPSRGIEGSIPAWQRQLDALSKARHHGLTVAIGPDGFAWVRLGLKTVFVIEAPEEWVPFFAGFSGGLVGWDWDYDEALLATTSRDGLGFAP